MGSRSMCTEPMGLRSECISQARTHTWADHMTCRLLIWSLYRSALWRENHGTKDLTFSIGPSPPTAPLWHVTHSTCPSRY